MRELTQEVEIDEPAVLLCDLALFERDQGRDAADAEAGGDRRSSSTLTLAKRARGSSSFAARSKIGAIARHGPHHGAQKSTISGMSLRSTCLSNVSICERDGFEIYDLF